MSSPTTERRGPSNANEITAYLHCRLCLDEMTLDEVTQTDEPMSPQDYQRVQVGYTRRGLQVWCVRHEVNVLHIDFEGHRHPANTSRPATR
jgi:hypothetical protein